jgi:hypothetical protein
MIVGILQPGYLPWLGFFEQMQRSDIFVIYDDVQYDKHGWRNRNKIKAPNGAQWLTVPVLIKFNEHTLINEVKINNEANWRKKHLFSIRQNYSKAPYYHHYSYIFEEAYEREWEYLIDLDIHFIFKLAEVIGIDTGKVTRSSTLSVMGDRIERLINICKKFNADTFYEGTSGKNYIEEEAFSKEGIRVIFQDYRHPIYDQLYGNFIPYLSVIDLLFNQGDKSLSVLMHQT